MHKILAQLVIDFATIRNISEPVVGAFLIWLVKTWINTLRIRLNEIITDNVNRIRGDLMNHVDDKFKQHEIDAFKKIDTLETLVKQISR
jgi:hypothetical protein